MYPTFAPPAHRGKSALSGCRAACMGATGRDADISAVLALAVRVRRCVFHTPICIVPPSPSSLKLCGFEWVPSSSSGRGGRGGGAVGIAFCVLPE